MNHPSYGQIFNAEGGIVPDYENELNRTFFPVHVEGLPIQTSCDDFGLKKVCFNIIHERLNDLKVTLRSPHGTEVWLSNRNGENAVRYTNTCFMTDGFSGFIYNGIAPYSGEFIPDGNIDLFNNNEDPNGFWFLIVEDLAIEMTGAVVNFNLEFGSNISCLPTICELETIQNCSCPDEVLSSCDLLPDLVMVENNSLENISFFDETHDQYPNQLRFSAAMMNIGHGPLEVTPVNRYFCGNEEVGVNTICPNGVKAEQQINQNIYQKKREQYAVKERDSNRWYFDDSPGHNHYHVRDWVDFKILKKRWWTRNPKKWKTIAASNKVSYCLMDSNHCREDLDNCTSSSISYSRSNLVNFGLGDYNQCNQNKQGISVGGVDNYGVFYEGQMIEIPNDISPGKYYLYLEIDAKNHYLEENENNNSFHFPIIVRRIHDKVSISWNS